MAEGLEERTPEKTRFFSSVAARNLSSARLLWAGEVLGKNRGGLDIWREDVHVSEEHRSFFVPDPPTGIQGVLDLPVFEALTHLFRKTPFYQDKDTLHPVVSFPDDRSVPLRVYVRRVDSYRQRYRTAVLFDIPDLHSVLEARQDIPRARRLGLLGGTAATFSITKLT